jgi:hypothetical protein
LKQYQSIQREKYIAKAIFILKSGFGKAQNLGGINEFCLV